MGNIVETYLRIWNFIEWNSKGSNYYTSSFRTKLIIVQNFPSDLFNIILDSEIMLNYLMCTIKRPLKCWYNMQLTEIMYIYICIFTIRLYIKKNMTMCIKNYLTFLSFFFNYLYEINIVSIIILDCCNALS